MKPSELKARREARLNRPPIHRCGLQSRLYLCLRFRGDKWVWYSEIHGREVIFLYCPWCGQSLEAHESSNSKSIEAVCDFSDSADSA
jgi:transcription elongation factor Elf1